MKTLGSKLVLPLAALLTLPWVWYFLGIVTWQGWVITSWGLSLIWLAAIWLKQKFEKSKRREEVEAKTVSPLRFRWLLLCLLAIFLTSTFVLFWQTPPRQSSEGAAVSNQFSKRSGRRAKLWRFSLSNIVPEKEQINLGFRLMPFVDPFLTYEQVAEISEPTFRLYDELATDPDFRDLGCVLGSGYAEIGQLAYDNGHYFLYDPKSVDPETPKPTIVFLHGSGGNFKPYLWLWSKLAEQEGYVVIAPTFGFGNWYRKNGMEAIRSALEDAKSKTNIDSDRIYLAGLSNGGLGVSQAAAIDASRYRGAIYLSPVFNTDFLESPEYRSGWQGRPHLVITGEVDKRIPIKFVNDCVGILMKAGVQTTYEVHPNQDHFLLFNEPQKVMEQIAAWLRECQAQND